MDPTLFLIGLAILLVLVNAGMSFLPRKSKVGNVVVSFVPPSSIPLSSSSNDISPKLDAHIISSNQKISLLFSRVEKMERDIQALFEQLGITSTQPPSDENPPSDATWLETPPIRKRRKKA
jgi:hypothetical protein